MEREHVAEIARTIAALVVGKNVENGDVRDLERRIAILEARLGLSTESKNPAAHSSQEKFKIAEAIVDRAFAAKTADGNCSFEPGNKPCDHCSMCSSRGF